MLGREPLIPISHSLPVPRPPADDDTVSAVSIWIGLDGYTSEVIIQAGVDVIEDDTGDLTFKAWVEVGAGGPPLSSLSISQE